MAPAATGWVRNWAELTEKHEDNSQNVEWTLVEGKVAMTEKLALTFDVEKNYKNVTNGETLATYWDNRFGFSYDLGKSGDWDLSAGLDYYYDTNSNGSNEVSQSSYSPWIEAGTALTDNVDLTLWAAMYYQDGVETGVHGDDYELDILFDTGEVGFFDWTGTWLYLYHNTSAGHGSNENTSLELEMEAFTTLYKADNGFYAGVKTYFDGTAGDKAEESVDFAPLTAKIGWSKKLDDGISVWTSASYELVSMSYSKADSWNPSDAKEFQVVAGVKATF
jgi:outer membrane protein assembly factor BamA